MENKIEKLKFLIKKRKDLIESNLGNILIINDGVMQVIKPTLDDNKIAIQIDELIKKQITEISLNIIDFNSLLKELPAEFYRNNTGEDKPMD